MYRVTDLQAVEPDALEDGPGISVERAPELDSMGFARVTVESDTLTGLVRYVVDQWGTDDKTWIRDYVLNRIEGGDREYAITSTPDDPSLETFAIISADSPLEALDAYAVSEGFPPYSELMAEAPSAEERKGWTYDYPGVVGAMGAIFTNYEIVAMPTEDLPADEAPSASYLRRVEDAWQYRTRGTLSLADDDAGDGPADRELAALVVGLGAYVRRTLDDTAGQAQVDETGEEVDVVSDEELAARMATALDCLLFGTRAGYLPGPNEQPICGAIVARAEVTAKLAEALDISTDPFAGDAELGTEKALAVVGSIVTGVVREYMDGGDQLVELCTCGQHHGEPQTIREAVELDLNGPMEQARYTPPEGLVFLVLGGSAIAYDEGGEIVETVEWHPDGSPDWAEAGICDHRGEAGPGGFYLLRTALDAAEANARLVGVEVARVAVS